MSPPQEGIYGIAFEERDKEKEKKGEGKNKSTALANEA